MDATEFRRRGKEMVDFVADYMEGIREYPPLSQVQPGYLRQYIPDSAPDQPDTYEQIVKDVNEAIMPGVTHWQHPHFHAYFPANTSFPATLADMLSGSIGAIGFSWVTHWHHPNFHAYFPTAQSYASTVADILSDSIACIGFSWSASPACTELEILMMDWLGKMLDLPQEFMSGGKGGGVIQGTASEATLVCLLAARSRFIHKMKAEDTSLADSDVIGKLVAYCSDQAHSSVERACLLGAVRCHKLTSDIKDELRGETLAEAMAEDKLNGLIPFYVVGTLGTTPSCSFDNIKEIGPVCREADVWFHIDAAYAGSSFICPEFRPYLDGVEFADSFNFNPHKWMLVTFDCSALWLRDSKDVVEAFNVDPLYLKYKEQGQMPDYRHWQIPLGRRFRSLKLWFVMRLYGVSGLQEHIRKHVKLAHQFEDLVRADDRFKVTHKVAMGLICFCLKDKSNEMNEKLLQNINKDGRIHMVPSKSKGQYFLRFAVCSAKTELSDIEFSWKVIKELATDVLKEGESKAP